MRLILEGPDNAGKTTLANRIVDQVGDFDLYRHPGGKPAGPSAEITCIEQQMEWLNRRRVVVDRITPISQQVYNPDPDLDLFRQQAWWQMLMLKPVVVYCRPSTDRLLRTDEFTWREGETEEHKQKIIENQHEFVRRYDLIFEKTPCISYSFEDEIEAKNIVDRCVAAMNGDHFALVHLRDHMNRWSK